MIQHGVSRTLGASAVSRVQASLAKHTERVRSSFFLLCLCCRRSNLLSSLCLFSSFRYCCRCFAIAISVFVVIFTYAIVPSHAMPSSSSMLSLLLLACLDISLSLILNCTSLKLPRLIFFSDCHFQCTCCCLLPCLSAAFSVTFGIVVVKPYVQLSVLGPHRPSMQSFALHASLLL